MLKNVYLMRDASGVAITYTPMCPDDAIAMGGESKEEMLAFLERNPGVTFTQDPNYILKSAYWHEDGTLDMIARYVGDPCGAEGCQCDEKPYEYFADGRPTESMTEEETQMMEFILQLTGVKPINLDLTAE